MAAAQSARLANPETASGDPPVVKVGSVVNALAVLRRLAATDRPEGVNAIARSVGISPSSCFNILKTLVAEEFAQFDPVYKNYTLGPGAVDLALAALDPEAGFTRTRRILDDVAREFSVTCGLWRRVGERLILLGAAENQDIARIRFTPGQRLPLLSGAMGRCVAAASDMADADLEKAIAGLDWHARPKPERYLADVRAAAAQGYAFDDGDFMLGVTSVAAPVMNREGAVSHCIVATTFKGRLDRQGLRTLGQAVHAAGEAAAPLLASVR